MWGQSVSANTYDLVAGIGAGEASGDYRENDNGITADLVLGRRVLLGRAGAVVVALSGGVQGAGIVDDRCIIVSGGGCAPSFPDFFIGSATFGWETRTGVLRILTGPAVVHVDESAWAWLIRADVAARLYSRLWFVVGGRAVGVPDYRNDGFLLGSVGAGLRIR